MAQAKVIKNKEQMMDYLGLSEEEYNAIGSDLKRLENQEKDEGIVRAEASECVI